MSQPPHPPGIPNGTIPSQPSVVTSTMAAAQAQAQAQAQQIQQAVAQAQAAAAQAQAHAAASQLGALPVGGGIPPDLAQLFAAALQNQQFMGPNASTHNVTPMQIQLGLGLPNGAPSLPLQPGMPLPGMPLPGMSLPGMSQPGMTQNRPRPTPSANSRPSTAASTNNKPMTDPNAKKSEIYKYQSPVPIFAAAWSGKRASEQHKFRLAVGTIIERGAPGGPNKVSIIELDEPSGQLVERCSVPHEFAVNRIVFIPDLNENYPDLIATSTDFLRLFKICHDTQQITEECVLTSAKSNQYGAALTSFDWNDVDQRLIGTSSIDTTCTIFDVEVGQVVGTTRPYSVKTQLIAHDKPVHDIAFSRLDNGRDNFATVGADGSARLFDLRHLEHSTIVYEDPQKQPLMRIGWNKHEPYHLATYAQDSTEVVIIDIRMPCSPICRLKNHNGPVNGIAWAPHSAHHICTAGDDSQALIWDLARAPRPIDDPILAYSAGGEVNQVHWGAAHINWISICFNKTLEILRV